MRVGMRVGPFYLSQSTRRSRRRPSPGPTAAQRQAQAARRAANQRRVSAARAERHARYGAFKAQDPRTWHTEQTILALILLIIVFSLPAILGDGAVAGWIWAAAVLVGLSAWAVWLYRLHDFEAPGRDTGIQQRQQAVVAEAQAAAQARADHAAYLAPHQIGNAWRHGACPVNHRTPDAAYRCTKGGA